MKAKFSSSLGWSTGVNDTVQVQTIPGRRNHFTTLDRLQMTTSGTLHTNTVMQPASKTTLSADAAASQAVINVTAALTDGGGNAIAANDYIVVELANGKWHQSTFASASTLAYTLNDVLPSAAKKGGNVFCYGVVGDAFQTSNILKPTVSTTDLSIPPLSVDTPLFTCTMMGAPLLLHNPHTTALDVYKDVFYSQRKM